MKQKDGRLESFCGAPKIDKQQIFTGGRFPNVVVSTGGTLIATWGNEAYWVRRSEDGGGTWGEPIKVAEPGFHGGGTVVDEAGGDIIVFNETEHPAKTPQESVGPLEVYRSTDDGRSWDQMEVTVHPDPNGYVPARHMCEHGVTLRDGEHAGRLLRPARVYNTPGAEPPRYACAIYSDDGGVNWHAGGAFPEPGMGEGALVELSDGRVLYTSRKSYFDTPPEEFHCRRHVAWSYDGGESWQDLRLVDALPDGPRYRGEEGRGSNYNGHFGMLAGLTRLPVEDRDILLYSNADTPGHERVNGTVWASFDGGQTWPIKRAVHEGPFAYSSLNAGRPGTPSEGWIYLQYEGGETDCYEGGWIARFNLAWLLEGEPTGDGDVPDPGGT